jgi:hypothetical protein
MRSCGVLSDGFKIPKCTSHLGIGLAVAIGVILNVKDAPSWLTQGGWIFLLVLCTVATIAILAFVTVAGWGYWMLTWGYYTNPALPNVPAGTTPSETSE